MVFKKGTNLTIVEHGGVDYISYNDLSNPFKNHKGKVADGAKVHPLIATDELIVETVRDIYLIDSASLKAFSISGGRPKNVRKR